MSLPNGRTALLELVVVPPLPTPALEQRPVVRAEHAAPLGILLVVLVASLRTRMVIRLQEKPERLTERSDDRVRRWRDDDGLAGLRGTPPRSRGPYLLSCAWYNRRGRVAP